MSLLLEDVRFSYGAATIVDGVSLRVAPGEIVCLLGPSGCGKTTLLRIAAGLERLASGTVSLDGVVLSGRDVHAPPEKREIGFVLQDFVLFPHMTVAENVSFGLAGLASEDRKAATARELRAVSLENFAQRTPDQLSGGQQQRVALARAFARRPRALLLDEPFASIDAVMRRRLRAEMRRMLKERAAPTVLVTHDPEEALSIGDRIAVMAEGKIVEDAPAERLFADARTRAGAALFPGAEVIAVRAGAEGLESDFGRLPAASPRITQGFAVIRTGAATVRPAAEGRVRAADCQFAGPDWAVTVESIEKPGHYLTIRAPSAIAPGTRLAVDFDAAALRIFPD